MYPSCENVQGDCTCNNLYIGEIEGKVITRLGEDDNPNHISEPAHHLKKQPEP